MPSSLDFGVVGYNTQADRWCTTSTRTVNVFNTCNYSVDITQIANSDALDFQLTGVPALPLVLAGGSQQTFNVEFTPQQIGVDYASLAIDTATSQSPYLVSLKGAAEDGGVETDTFISAPSTPQLDMLWLMDNDDDAPQSQLISQSVAALFQSASNLAGIDFHMAVITDSICTDNGQMLPCTGCVNASSPNAQIIASTDANPEAELQSLVNVPDNFCGEPDEQLLASLFEALQPSNLAGHNGGFLRPGAHLAIIAIDGDAEDDDSPQSLGYYFSFLENLKTDPSLLTFSYVNQGLSAARQPDLPAALAARDLDWRGRGRHLDQCLAADVERGVGGRHRLPLRAQEHAPPGDDQRQPQRRSLSAAGFTRSDAVDLRPHHQRDRVRSLGGASTQRDHRRDLFGGVHVRCAEGLCPSAPAQEVPERMLRSSDRAPSMPPLISVARSGMRSLKAIESPSSHIIDTLRKARAGGPVQAAPGPDAHGPPLPSEAAAGSIWRRLEAARSPERFDYGQCPRAVLAADDG